MKGCEAVASDLMTEYWGLEEKAGESKQFILNPPEAEIALDYEIESRNYAKAGKASSDIKLTLKKLGVNPEILRKISIACYEAEINVVAHSLGGNIFAYVYQDRVLIILKDVGPGIEDVEKAMLLGYSTADDLAREMGFGAGLGLPNIEKNCDAMHLTSAPGEETILEFLVYFQQ